MLRINGHTRVLQSSMLMRTIPRVQFAFPIPTEIRLTWKGWNYPRFGASHYWDNTIPAPQRRTLKPMKRVPLDQEINPAHVGALRQSAIEAVEACGKDVGAVNIECGEDAEGGRWLFIKVEIG